MDVNFSRKAEHIDSDYLVQEMVESQNGFNAENRNKVNGMVAEFKRSLQDFVDKNHPGLTVSQNGPHFQIMMSSFEDLAFFVLEVMYVERIYEQYHSVLDDVHSAIGSGAEPFDSILITLNNVKQKRIYFERCFLEVTLKARKLADLAKKKNEDLSFFGKLRRGISVVNTDKAIRGLDLLQTLGAAMENSKEQEETLIHLVQLRMQRLEVVNRVRDKLVRAQNHPNISPDIIAAFLHFFDLSNYVGIFFGEMFKDRINCVLQLVEGKTKTEDEVDILTSPLYKALGTLPFEVLNQLLKTVPFSTEGGRELRRKMVEDKAIHFVLDYLHRSTSTTEESKGNCTVQAETRKLTWLLCILLHFIDTPEGNEDSDFLSEVHEILKESSLISVLSGYLEKYSVFDFAGNVPLYKVIFKLLGSIASIPQLWPLLISGDGKGALDLVQLLPDIKLVAGQVEVAVMEYLKMERDCKGSPKMETEEFDNEY